MSADTRWTIAELKARYDLEPQLSDIFVEGSFDKDVLSHAAKPSIHRYKFYEIDAVYVSNETLAKYGLTSGNKQRVLALAHELNSVPSEARVVCLVDRDLDHWFGALSCSSRLRWTQFCSLEGHFLTAEIVTDVLLTTGRARIDNIKAFTVSLFNTLRFARSHLKNSFGSKSPLQRV